MITVYGGPGWGSTISELMLSLADIPYEVVDVEGFDQPGPARERLRQINPLCQVPTLRLADGSIMTETAAISGPRAGDATASAVSAGTPQRPQFQRL
ncbi:glutathione S-transferase N-terminal domain-containing protein, partial [Klebsiella pneumoniae]|uniref:glutathione S-transferase N-terminal domain-containing protein n=1 Tax=Klebsiella pneumoniae TaxID=573 RepID=UPI00237F8426